MKNSLIATGYGITYALGSFFYFIEPILIGYIIDSTQSYVWSSLFFFAISLVGSYIAKLIYEMDTNNEQIRELELKQGIVYAKL